MAVLADLIRVLTVPLDRLMTCINETSSVDVEQACDTIMRDVDGARLFSKETDQIRWKGFPSPPSSSNSNEEQTFMPPVDIFEAVFANVRGCGLSLVMNGQSIPLSEPGNAESRPDALLMRSRGRAVIPGNHWSDVAVLFACKKGADAQDVIENRQKLVWSLQCIMREDPCRQFAFGITIEDSNLRLWLSNRTFLAASQPINFLQEIKQTIRLFTYLAWASVASDMEGLGWDPAVKRLGDGPDSWQYEFKVGHETFTTTKALATYGADSLVGRGTRVYAANDSKGNTVAIKDSWRDPDRKQEGKILEDILKSCDGKLTKEEADEAKKASVQIKLYGDVYLSDKRDDTRNPTKGMSDGPVLWKKFELESVETKSTYLSSISDRGRISVSQPTTLHNVRGPTSVPCRVHTRTVFSDVGIPLQKITYLKTYLSTLKDAARAIYLLHRAGWVHRDFSVGNVIRISDRGKLGDFEFAKKVDSGDISHDVRTGTLKFMAVEVEAHIYLFGRCKMPKTLPVFRVNFIHDFESVWWAFAWVLFFHTDKNSNEKEKATRQHQEFQKAFPGWMGGYARRDFFTYPVVLGQASLTLCDTCRPLSVDLQSFSDALIDYYKLAESSLPKIEATPELLEALYKEVSTILQHAMDRATNIELCPVGEILVSKRSRDDEESLTGPVERKKACHC